MTLETLLTQLDNVTKTSGGYLARCPAHDDRKSSLSVAQGEAGKILLKCFAGCETEQVVQARGLTMRDLFADTGGPDPEPRIVKTYDYTDETGRLLFQVARYEPKTFKQRRPDGHGGWTWNLNGTRRIPYRLHDLAKSKPKVLYIAEGEKDVNRLWSLKLPATCNPGGAGQWAEEYTDLLLKLLGPVKTVIFAHNDDPGRKHAVQVARTCWGKVEAVKLLLALPGVPEKGDVSDYLAAHSKEELVALVKATPPLILEELARLEAADNKQSSYAEGGRPVLIRLAEVKPEPVTWLWPGRIPAGKVTLLDGDPSLGKSTIAFDLSARVSTGSPMPDNSRSQAEPGGVVILTAEDGAGDTVAPRLLAAGADMRRCVALQGIESQDGKLMAVTIEDTEALTWACREVAAKIVVIDPLMAYLPSKRNSWRDQDVRQALAPLARMAEETGAAVLVIRHLNKSGGSQSIYRGGGSIGIIGAARAGYLVSKDPENETQNVFACVKNNLASIPPSLTYQIEEVQIEEEITSTRIVWGGVSPHSADTLLAVPATPEEKSATEDAVEFLQTILAKGPLEAKEINRAARAAGIAEVTLRRAKVSAGVRSERDNFGRDGKWFWCLDDHKTSKALNINSEHLRGQMSILGDFEEV